VVHPLPSLLMRSPLPTNLASHLIRASEPLLVLWASEVQIRYWSRWKLTPPFQVPSTTFLQPSWSLLQHIPSQQSCNIYIHNIIHIHRPFSQGPFTSHIHISGFATILGQYSYFYRLGETGCYNSLPLKGTSSSMFYLST
jgi:hypothetical protein